MTAQPVATLQSHCTDAWLRTTDVAVKANFSRLLKVKEKRRVFAPRCRLHMTRVHSRGRATEQMLSLDAREPHTHESEKRKETVGTR